MSMSTRWRLMLALTIAMLWLGPSERAHADTTCTVTLGTPLAFGNVAANGTTDAVATLNVSCATAALSVLGYAQVSLCLDLGPGSASSGVYAPRRMLNSTSDSLDFQIYSEATRTQIWGATGSAAPSPRTLTLSYTVPVITGGSQTATITVYGRIPANQTLSVGNHTSSFGGADTVLRYSYNESITGMPSLPSSCTAGGTGSKTASNAFPFTASATVPARCNAYVTTDLDFGSIAGSIDTAIDRSSTISLACTNRTAWNIGWTMAAMPAAACGACVMPAAPITSTTSSTAIPGAVIGGAPSSGWTRCRVPAMAPPRRSRCMDARRPHNCRLPAPTPIR